MDQASLLVILVIQGTAFGVLLLAQLVVLVITEAVGIACGVRAFQQEAVDRDRFYITVFVMLASPGIAKEIAESLGEVFFLLTGMRW